MTTVCGADLLEQIIDRESRSLVHYVAEAFPWATSAESAALAEFDQVAASEREQTAALARHLFQRHRRTVKPGPFPQAFTTINFVSLEYLLPRLVTAEQAAIAQLENDLTQLADAADRAAAAQLLATKQQNLKRLESLASAHPLTHSTVH